jgi:excisionase family DNA binding protein
MNEDTLVTVAEAAEILRLTPTAVRSAIKRGEIPSYRLGKRRIRLRRDELEQLLERREARR